MPRIYENAKRNFSSFAEFKEVAAKTLNEIYGRVRPLDVIDFSYNDTHYKAIGYYNDEVIPAAQKAGAPISKEASAAEAKARADEAANKKAAADEAAAEELRIRALYAEKKPVTYEDLVLANKLGIELPEEIAQQLAAGVKEGKFSYEAAHAAGLTHIDGVPTLEAAKNALKQSVVNNEVAAQNAEAALTSPSAEEALPPFVKETAGVKASEAAIKLAEENGVDLTKIEGTGSQGIIKVSDVKDYIANHAPAKENADENDSKQSHA